MKTLSINSHVRIKITPFGIAKLKEQHERLFKNWSTIPDFIPPKVDKDGYSTMLLWQVMNNFGEYMSLGATQLPFEDIIQIDDAEFENVKY